MLGKRANRVRLLAAVGFAVTLGLIAIGVSVGAVGDEDEPLYPERKEISDPSLRPEPTKLPRPDEKSAGTITAAVEQLRSVDTTENVVDAALRGEAATLLALSNEENFCETKFREPQPLCAGRQEYPGYYVQAGLPQPVLMPKELVDRYLDAILSNEPIELTLVAKDAGQDGKYYLVFKASGSVELDGSDYDSVGLVVQPDAAKPIRWFRFILPTNNGLEWLQILAGADSGVDFELVAPESIKDWPGLWGEKGN